MLMSARAACCSASLLLAALGVLYDGAPAVAAAVNGRIQYYTNRSDVAGVTVQAQGAAPTTAQFDASGRYAFADLADQQRSAPPVGPPAALRVHVLGVTPHDPHAFTQGLLLHNGQLYESAGLYGASNLRAVDRATGQVVRTVNLASNYFGEGLARVGNRLIQLTWVEHVAFVYDLTTFGSLGQLTYTTQGWGICHDGTRLVMSDGSSTLYFRDPATFAVTGQVNVTLNGQPRGSLNELECVGDAVYANVWLTDTIVKIDPRTGVVTAVIDASGLLTPAERASADVLNGIAYDEGRGTFLITGKLWPKLFEVQFVPTQP